MQFNFASDKENVWSVGWENKEEVSPGSVKFTEMAGHFETEDALVGFLKQLPKGSKVANLCINETSKDILEKNCQRLELELIHL